MPIINLVYEEPKLPFTPWVNTLAYYPLTSTSTVNDRSGNNNNLTQSWTVTFWVNWWVNCGYFDWWYLILNSSLITWANPRTVSCWFYRINAISEWWAFWGMWTPSSQQWYTTYVSWTSPTGRIGHWNRQSDVFSTIPCPINWWNLLVVTFNWTTVKVYLDNVQILSTNLTLNLTSWNTTICQMPSLAVNAWKWYMSEFIFENIERDATKRTDYYNSTKTIYGL